MRILHLFSNWKWTGPAEPAANLALGLSARGHEVRFYSGLPPRGRRNWVEEAAAERGLAVSTGLVLRKHHHPVGVLRDRGRLRRIVDRWAPDLVHCHLPGDHMVALGVARRVPVVRSVYDGDPLRPGLRTRKMFKDTAFVLSASERVRAGIVDAFGFPGEQTLHLEGAVDLARFDPERELPDMSGAYGIEEGDFVLGIVARVQPRRRFDVFFDALDRVAAEVPNLRVLVVGRGTHIRREAEERAEKAILRDRIVFTGYRSGDEYVGTLARMAAKVFLWPGSDGSCRAVREAMAMGVPVIAAEVGMLPEIVTDGADGIVVPHDPDALAHAVRRLALGLEERAEMSRAALAAARSRFDLAGQVEQVERVYERLLQDAG